MTLQDLGAIGEFLGAIGVIASLIYLALQVRQASRASTANMFQARSDSIANTFALTLQSPDLLNARLKHFAGEPLEPAELWRVRIWFNIGLRYAENAFVQARLGLTYPGEDKTIDSYLVAMIEQGRDLFREMWHERADQFSPEFKAHMERLMTEQATSDRAA